jgi:hypothetical protein
MRAEQGPSPGAKKHGADLSPLREGEDRKSRLNQFGGMLELLIDQSMAGT